MMQFHSWSPRHSFQEMTVLVCDLEHSLFVPLQLQLTVTSIAGCAANSQSIGSCEKKMKSMDFELQELESSFVTPSESTPSQGLWLSSLDLMHANRGHTSTIYLYSSSGAAAGAADFFDVARLKEAMAKALVAFYPLAGRLGVNDDGRMEISCNGKGALFVIAQADDLTADDVKKFKPSPELRRLFVPLIDEPASSIMLAVQVHVHCFLCLHMLFKNFEPVICLSTFTTKSHNGRPTIKTR
jgi:hypothetical protein